MIVTGFLYIIYFALYALTLPLRLLSDVSADSTVVTAITNTISYVASFNLFLPLGALFSVVASILAVETGIAVYKIIAWMLRRIPTQS